MVVSLSACGSLPKFPVPTLKQPLVDKNVTHEYEYKNDEWSHLKTHPLSYVNGMFCVTEQEYLDIRNWLVDIKDNYTCKLKTNGQKEQ